MATATGSGNPKHRSVYLVTYSQADGNWSRESYADAVVSTFEQADCQAVQWVCSKEDHAEGGHHFHLAIKLNRQKRWLRVRKQIAKSHGINVNFSDGHSQYYDAWQYVTKEDLDFVEIENHPDLSAGFVPRTISASNQRRSTSSSATTPPPASTASPSTKRRRFDSLDLADTIIARNIRTKEDLLSLVQVQREEGKRDLPLYVLNNIDRCVKLIATTWEMQCAKEERERSSKTRIQILRESVEAECVEGCNGRWIQLARETLSRNGLGLGEFSRAVVTLMTSGRGKHRNILITGPANCGKSFLLNPLQTIFRSFTNPAQNTFAWIGVEKAEVIYLNDLRYSEKLIPWNIFLQLLEGAEVRLSAPKNHSPEDIKFVRDTPIFATSIAPVRKYIAGVVHEGETEMMACRWNTFRFTHQIDKDNVQELPSCGKCFATLVFFF